MRHILYWSLHALITAATWALLTAILGWPGWLTAIACAGLAFADDELVAALASQWAGRG